MDEFDPKMAATDLVAAFVSNNTLAAEELPTLLATVFAAVTALGAEPAETAPEPTKYVPAVDVETSTSDPEYLVSLITGEKLKTLKRHLRRHGLTPAEYKERYNLPRDYPMVAPAYSETRRAVAERLGLGRKRPAVASPEAPPAPEPVAAPPVKARRSAKAKAAPAIEAPTSFGAAKRGPRAAKPVTPAPAEEAAEPTAAKPARRGRKPAVEAPVEAPAPRRGRKRANAS